MAVIGCANPLGEHPEAVKPEQFAYQRMPEMPFCGLGDLPGGRHESRAYGVSADGRVVIGCSSSSNVLEEA
jgi:hypothetical protein